MGVGFVPTAESSSSGTGSRRVRYIGTLFATAICAAYLVIEPPSQDFASGHFRAELADRGVYLWDNLWFGGHPLPGFGIVSPVLGSVFGVVPVARDLGSRCDVVLRVDRREVARARIPSCLIRSSAWCCSHAGAASTSGVVGSPSCLP